MEPTNTVSVWPPHYPWDSKHRDHGKHRSQSPPKSLRGGLPTKRLALEVAAGACYGGARALAAMKHVGLNVAADPFMTLSYTGVNGGLVIVVCDDPEMHSSQNEQDTSQLCEVRQNTLSGALG